MRPAFLIALLSALLLTTAPSASADTASSVTAAGRVSIQTSATGRVRLVVPSDATLDLSPSSLTGGTDFFTGFLLTEPNTRSGLFAEVIRYPSILSHNGDVKVRGQKAVVDRKDETVDPTDAPKNDTCDPCHIPPGTYDLYAIANGTPLSITIELQGLSGELRLTKDDLTPTRRLTTGTSREGVVSPLKRTISQSGQGNFIVGHAIAYTQYATRVDTETTGLAEHTFCIQAAGLNVGDCEGEQYTHSVYPLAEGEQLTGFPVWDLAAGSYQAGDSFDAQATATPLTWSKAWSGIILEF